MISLQNTTLRRGDKYLLHNANLMIHAGQTVGIIGKNGCGKSSFFQLLLGALSLENGELNIPQQLRVGHLAQSMPDSLDSTLHYTLAGNSVLNTLYSQLHQAEQADDGMCIARLHQQLAEHGAYQAQSQAAKVLTGLGFQASQLDTPVNDFSGGWRMRLNLARVLLSEADVLLLDEPTNHLDLEAILWLQEWIKSSGQTILLISHDRELLDATVTHIAHFAQHSIKTYPGNYSQFEAQRTVQIQTQQAAYQKQQKIRRHLNQFVERFRYKATKARQAQSRLKQLTKMQLIEWVDEDIPFEFTFEQTQSVSNPVMSCCKLDIGYQPDQPVLKQVSISLNQGDRIGLLGANGAGKSTLMKAFCRQLPHLLNAMHISPKAVIGHFSQAILSQLDPQSSAYEHLLKQAPDLDDTSLRKFLGRFHFHGDAVFRLVGSFSGGEQVRLALALLVYQKPHVLLMDEPTNHLDMDMREALSYALQQFDGTLVVISHDRFFLNSVCDDLWLVHNNHVSTFQGDLDDYRQWLLSQSSPKHKPSKPTKPKSASPLKQQQQLTKQLNQLECQHDELHQAVKTLDEQLADPQLYQSADHRQSQSLNQQRQTLITRIAQLEQQILTLMEKLT
jgi:ATP-binding cassette subfamily F protein 3